MGASIFHRRPNGTSVYEDNRVFIGYIMHLAILDLPDAARQSKRFHDGASSSPSMVRSTAGEYRRRLVNPAPRGTGTAATAPNASKGCAVAAEPTGSGASSSSAGRWCTGRFHSEDWRSSRRQGKLTA